MTNVWVGWSRNCALLDLLETLPAPDPAALTGVPDLGNLDFTSLYLLSFIADPDSFPSFHPEQLVNDPPGRPSERLSLSLRKLTDERTEVTPQVRSRCVPLFCVTPQINEEVNHK